MKHVVRLLPAGAYRRHLLSLLLCLLAYSPLLGQTVSSFSPTSGPVGSLVTLTGTGLTGLTSASVGGVAAVIVNQTGTSAQLLVMPGAATGAVSVTGGGAPANGPGSFTLTATPTPTTQQVAKLQASDFSGDAQQGFSVALSADGNTALVGGPGDNSSAGAAFVYTRSGTTWSQQGTKLIGSGAVGAARQGWSVALSADGNTALVGGDSDNLNAGAVWVFTRTGSVWSQQGSKLVGTGATGAARQGWSVALSADGNTALVGGQTDNANAGAIWVFTRVAGVWSQQGTKLVGTGAVGNANQGYSVALSADGTTALSGGFNDNSTAGAAWVFTRSGSTWNQQGSKLVGADATTGGPISPALGYSVALNADGNTAWVGGYNDNNEVGAAFVFTRTGSTWSQQGTKLVGTGAVGSAQQGYSVALSADGNTALSGALRDNSFRGAAWVFARSGTTWAQVGAKLADATVGGSRQYSVAISANGSTAIVGGLSTFSSQGAIWIYTAAPTLASFAPTTAGTGQTVTLTGTNFTGATAVNFGGTAAQSFSVVSPTSITAVVGTGATGSVEVVTPNGTATSSGTFTYSTVTANELPADYLTRFELGPNPTPGELRVRLEAAKSFGAQFRVRTLSGTEVYQGAAQLRATEVLEYVLQLAHLAPGAYLLEVSDGATQERLLTRRIVKD